MIVLVASLVARLARLTGDTAFWAFVFLMPNLFLAKNCLRALVAFDFNFGAGFIMFTEIFAINDFLAALAANLSLLAFIKVCLFVFLLISRVAEVAIMNKVRTINQMYFRIRLSEKFAASKRAFDFQFLTCVFFELFITHYLVLLRTPLNSAFKRYFV